MYDLITQRRELFKDTFAKRLKQKRSELGWRQAAFAAHFDLKTNTYASYEQGYNEPNVSLAALWARELHCSVDWLLGLSD